MTRLFSAALAVVLAGALAAHGQEIDNPYKNAKVGDYANYTMNMKVGDIAVTGTIVSTVTARTDKEVTVKTAVTVNGMAQPAQEQKIDITKPFDPTKMTNLPPGADLKVEKGKDGKEKLKVAGKEYDTTWTTFKVKGKAQGIDINADVKAWISKDIPVGLAKMEMNAEVVGMKMTMLMELTETGNKK